MGGTPALVWVMFEKLLTVKTYHVTKHNQVPQTWIDPLV
jgi:hypothetical protein